MFGIQSLYTTMRISFLFLLMTSGWTFGQTNTSVSLTVLEDSIKCQFPCAKMQLTAKLSNRSGSDLLLYGLTTDGPRPVDLPLSKFCDPKKSGTGFVFNLFQEDGKHRVDEIDFHKLLPKHFTKAFLDSMIVKNDIDFLKSALLLKDGAGITLNHQINVKDFYLENGEYYMQIIYFVGETSSHLSEMKRTAGDQNAKLFIGCAMTGRIYLTIGR